jgi:hypothetical protein
MSTDLKTSLLVNRQVPEYVREEYPVFISFLEAYYEFLETEQGNQKNDLIKVSKDLKSISDVDVSIEEFERNFFNTYASLIPRETAVSKEILIKNVLPLYLSKGSEKSFKLLFRLLFGQEVEVKYPKNDILRASDGKWLVENVLKVTTELYTPYTGDGTTKTFLIGPCRCPITESPLPIRISVFIDGVLQTTGFFLRQETKKLIFNTAPANGSLIEIFYRNFDFDSVINRQLTGLRSNATALVEKVGARTVNNERINDLYISSKTLNGEFSFGEEVSTNIFYDDTEILIPIRFKTVSSILSINIIDGGSNYNVGDPVIVNSPDAVVEPKAVISKVFSGTINQVNILEGGAGFQLAERIAAVGFLPSELNFAIAAVNTTGLETANTFRIFSDVISDIDPANTTIDASEWYFPGNISSSGVVNSNSVIAHAFSNTLYTIIGSISNVAITNSNIIVSSTPELNAFPAFVDISPLTANTVSNTIVKIDTFGSLGKIRIVNGGSNYEVGDEVQFTNQPMSFGIGAEAEVREVSLTGRIIKIEFVPSKITGTANVTSLSNVMVEGTGTIFEDELVVGDQIMINGETKNVVSIASNTSLNVDSFFADDFNDKPIRLWGKTLVGGQNYTQDKLPTAIVLSNTGSGANIVVTAVMGDGEDLLARGTKRPGEIEEILVTDFGSGIVSVPQVILTDFGDGTALANASLSPSYESLPGRWTTSDSILSSLDRRLQGRDFYVNYSYLLSSSIEFSKYKKIFKELLHPAGFKEYAEWNRLNELTTDSSTLDIVTAPKNVRALSGKVNIANSSIYVTGDGTKFNIANSLGIITIGSYIAINSEIRIVDSIISNTNLAVTSAFTVTANLQDIVVVNTVYEAIATEVSLDEIIAENELVLTVES